MNYALLFCTFVLAQCCLCCCSSTSTLIDSKGDNLNALSASKMQSSANRIQITYVGDHYLGRYYTRYRHSRDSLIPESTAVKLGLAWLAGKQSSSGTWSVFVDNSSDSESAHRTLDITPFVLLAFLSDGHSKSSGQHRGVVKKALRSLYNSLGCFTGMNVKPHDKSVFYWILSCLAICEHFAFSGRYHLHSSASIKSLNMLLSCRNHDGLWSSGIPNIGSAQNTAWAVTSILTAKKAGFLFLGDPLESTSFLSQLCKKRENTIINRYLSILLSNSCAREFNSLSRKHRFRDDLSDLMTLFLLSQVKYLSNEKEWVTFKHKLFSHLSNMQIQRGPNAGSWIAHNNTIGMMGPIFSTALAIIILETENRSWHLKKTKTLLNKRTY